MIQSIIVQLIAIVTAYSCLALCPGYAFGQSVNTVDAQDLVERYDLLTPDTETQRELRKMGLDVLREARAKGHSRVGGLQLEDLERDLHQVQIVIAPSVPVLSSELRFGAVNLTGQNMVVLNLQSMVGYSLGVRNKLILHELLGARGYHDENYELTSVISNLGLDQPTLFSNARAHEILRSLTTRRHAQTKTFDWLQSWGDSWQEARGGVTGVGGGGNGWAIDIKRGLLLLNDRAGESDIAYTRLEKILKLRVEVISDREIERATFYCSSHILRHDCRLVLVQERLWTHGSNSDKINLLRDIIHSLDSYDF